MKRSRPVLITLVTLVMAGTVLNCGKKGLPTLRIYGSTTIGPFMASSAIWASSSEA